MKINNFVRSSFIIKTNVFLDMKIAYQKTNNPNIDIIELDGKLIGNGALELQGYLYTRLDKGKFYQLMNLKGVQKIDALGIKVICDFVNRGMRIGLFNVEGEIRMMLRMSGKEEMVNIYNEMNADKVFSMFEKEVSWTEDKSTQGLKNRKYPRISTDFPAEFKYHPGHNGVISGMARVINLSEGGLLAGHIVAMNTKNGEILSRPRISGQELYGMNFRLNGGSDVVETNGECIREFSSNDKVSAGIRFKGMSQDHKEKIRDYVYNVF